MNQIGGISTTRINIAIGLVSTAIIAFQLVLMQILSYVQWYHFAYMIISIALLGFGAAGTFLTIFRERLQQNYNWLFPLLILLTAVLMSIVVKVAGLEVIRFDTLLIFHDYSYAGRLLLTYLIYFLPFFTGALAIGMSFLKFSKQIGSIYMANLLGSGMGGIIAILLMHLMLPEQLPVVVAFIALIGGLVAYPKNAGKLLHISAIGSIIILLAVYFSTHNLVPSEYKDISRTMLLPEASIENEKSTPYGLVQVVSSPVLRYAPGVSLNYRKPFPIRKAVFNNGNWNGNLVPNTDQQNTDILNYTPQSLPYHIEKINRVLILDAGTGENVSLALSNNVLDINASEDNAIIFGLLQNSFRDQDVVKLHQATARSFLVSDTSGYDLIQLPVIGSFFGNSGLNAIEPRYELTIEAFHEMWDKLRDDGMISVSCWMDYPVRNTYKIIASINQLLDEKNIDNPSEHIVAIRSWSAFSILVKKTGFTNDHGKQVIQFCNDMMFDPLLLPGNNKAIRGIHNVLQDSSFFINIEQLSSTNNKEFLNEYPFRIKAATDDKPFFFQNLQWSGINQLITSFGEGSIPFFELGYVLILLTFIQIIVIAGVFIILPLLLKSWKSNSKMWIIVYFSGIGLAFMFVEIVTIQQFTFYFGQPIYGAAASISILLIASAMGSYYSGSLRITKKLLLFVPVVIAILILLNALVLSNILSSTMDASLVVKIIVSIVLIGITGFFLGIPFPAGIKYLSEGKQTDIPWAWAFNGYFSVISTALATIISVETGMVWVLLLAANTYALTGLSSSFLKR
ncbi:MAG: hypothetical protein ISR55_07470 [Bacteroidetes bacterium]|nr:hypothetical protein [Bacteroidota bacterium]MBL6963645.1 hypothetical protein [Bacteroidota bacterium]